MAKNCGTERDVRAIELPIAGQQRFGTKKMGRRRALVLILVHAVVAVHVAHWLLTGKSVTPVEPSESMEFSTQGIINAGLVFFVLAIGSTLVLGRWFCGWGCHVVALQDLCGTLLTKVGVRPKQARLGILGVVPWLAFVYMFLAPIADRLLAGESIAATSTHFFTEDLWRTFPRTLGESLATFAVVGFVIVWLLGAKGFCTYGCPYGGIFGAVDQLAPLRIRVSDACEGCGKCSAVCTSNVNVAREVREYGMVVDPGCMKCLDCVEVCPNDALRVGWGVPAMFARARVDIAQGARKLPWARWVFLAVFIFTALSTFLVHDGVWELKFALGLSAFALVVALVFQGKSRRTADYTLAEEVLLAALFLFAMLSFRGLFQGVPFLFALGLSAILAWAAVQGLRMLYARDVKLQRHALKLGGRWTTAGIAFAVVLVPVGALWAHGFKTMQATRAETWARRHAPRIEDAAHAAYNRGVAAAQANRFDEAIAEFRRAAEIDPRFLAARENLAGMLCQIGRYADGLAEYERALEQNPDDADTHAFAAQAALALGDVPRAIGHLETAVRIAPQRDEFSRFLADVRKQTTPR